MPTGSMASEVIGVRFQLFVALTDVLGQTLQRSLPLEAVSGV